MSVKAMEQLQFSLIMKSISRETVLLIHITYTALNNIKRLAQTSKPFTLNVKAILPRLDDNKSDNKHR